MESFLWVVAVSGNGTTVVFLEGLLTLSNLYEKVKIFQIIENLKKTLGKHRQPIWSKNVFLSYGYPR